MNENHEEQRRRKGYEGEGPRIVSIQEPELEERAPPGISTRRYTSEWARRPGTSPQIVKEPRKSGRGGFLLKILVLVLVCSNMALFWTHQQQRGEIEELISYILKQSFKEIKIGLEKNEFRVGEPLRITVSGYTSSLFLKFGLRPEKVAAEIIISKDGNPLDSIPLKMGISKIDVKPGEKVDAGLYEVILRITYKGVTEEWKYEDITIQEK
ncbi:MAG: hypothetical protein AYK18_17395 [Theionarchaea archaeon DG-70]|nr:MAG: hypothetical protein AYK18_17395 [Theionarchaea archaeon DG-70]